MTRVLFICTANRCRSPMAEGFAHALIGPSRAEDVTFESAGLMEGGHPSTPEAIAVMGGRGIDISSHISSQLATPLDSKFDLILGMARQHLRPVIDNAPELFARAFTLKELVRRAEVAGPRQPGEEFSHYVNGLSAGRSLAQLARMISEEDDIADPIGRGRAFYEKSAEEIENLIRSMIEHLWPQRT